MSAAQRVAHAAKTIRAAWVRGITTNPQMDAAQALEDTGQLLNPEVADQMERRRVRMAKAEADLLQVRGLLSPSGRPRRVPPEVEIHERVAPAVEWLLGRVGELEAVVEPELCADCGHVEAAHSKDGETDCTASGARVLACTCAYFIPGGDPS